MTYPPTIFLLVGHPLRKAFLPYDTTHKEFTTIESLGVSATPPTDREYTINELSKANQLPCYNFLRTPEEINQALYRDPIYQRLKNNGYVITVYRVTLTTL